jgi:hypothetical protein
MKLINKQLLATALLVALGASPLTVMAESASVTGGGNLEAKAHLNLRVTIPRFLHFRVGTAGGTIDQIVFAPTETEVGDGNTIDGTGGDAGAGGASVAIRSNGGAITITARNDGGVGGLGTGVGNISLSEITAASDNGALPTPVLSDTGGDTSSPSLNGGSSSVTNQTAIWTYSYDNTTTPDAGDYDAQIEYTAANF